MPANYDLDGFEREVYLINGQQPGALIDVGEGDAIGVVSHRAIRDRKFLLVVKRYARHAVQQAGKTT